jgi:hypothetical protein
MFTSAENAMQEAYKKASALIHGTNVPALIDKYEGVAGDIKRNTASSVMIKRAVNGVAGFTDGATNLSYISARAFFEQIDAMYVGAQHTDVKGIKVWKKYTSANPASCSS